MGEVRQTVSPRPESINRLRTALHSLSSHYNETYLESDPLRFPHRYREPADQEAVAFLSAMLAFGNVKVIFRSLDWILPRLGNSPTGAILKWPTRMPEELTLFSHRWFTGSDLHVLFLCLREIYSEEESLERYFLKGYDPKRPDIEDALESFSTRFRAKLFRISNQKKLSRGLQFLCSSPSGGSSCKRLNLFLRWVVRREPPDLGLWREISPSKLLLPIDTHLQRLVQYVGLTKRRTAGWRMVMEATASLRKLDPVDPIQFDFSLSRLGILDRCKHVADGECCPQCPLNLLCILNNGEFPPKGTQTT